MPDASSARTEELFLDEIAEVGGDFQVKLLRVLQEGEVLRVGGTAPRHVDVRVVAASNRVIQGEIAAGRFREDLFFRLNVIPLHIPSLRRRAEDIIPLARHFLSIHAAEANRKLEFSPESEAALLKHRWPGNVRELENVVERAAVLCTNDRIRPEDLMLDRPISGRELLFKGSLQDSIDDLVRARIVAALDASEATARRRPARWISTAQRCGGGSDGWVSDLDQDLHHYLLHGTGRVSDPACASKLQVLKYDFMEKSGKPMKSRVGGTGSGRNSEVGCVTGSA